MGSGNLIFALMYKGSKILEEALTELKNNFGEVADISPEYSFNFTDYYEKEFGANLKKTIVIFNKKIEKKGLIKIKNKIAEIEKKHSLKGKRTINIDPGYINEKELVLASFKGKDFKEDLGGNVFAHKVLGFGNGKANEFGHTFPDFRQKELQKFLLCL